MGVTSFNIDTHSVTAWIEMSQAQARRGRKRIDLVIMYKILAALKEHGGSLNISSLYRAAGINPNTAVRYADILEQKGLVESEYVGRERRLRLTRKGEDYIFLFQRILVLVGEQV